MKRVYSNASLVISIWANQSQSDARCKNAFFENKKIWSYGSHYLLGELREYNGQSIALVNGYRWSKTTSSQIGDARHSAETAGHLVIEIDNDRENCRYFSNNTRKLVADFLISEQANFLDRLVDCSYSNKYYWRDNEILGEIKQFNIRCQKLGHFDFCIFIPKDYWNYCLKVRQALKMRAQDLEYNRRQLTLDNFYIFSGHSGNYIKACKKTNVIPSDVLPSLPRLARHKYFREIA